MINSEIKKKNSYRLFQGLTLKGVGVIIIFTMIWAESLLAKPEIIVENTPNCGINVYPLESKWNSRSMMYRPVKLEKKDWVATGKDFFLAEYGAPLAFTTNWFKQNAYASGKYLMQNGMLSFNTDSKGFSFGFGQSVTTPSALGIRFGAGWNQARKDVYRLKLKLHQSNTTKWRFGYFTSDNGHLRYKKVKEFTVNGIGTQIYEENLGFVREVIPSPLVVGVQFDCMTPDSQVKVENITIFSASSELFFRRKFRLTEAPVIAKATFRVCPSYDLYINGQKVDSGNKVYPAGLQKTVNIQPFLRKGENSIAFSREFRSWSGGNPEWQFEGMAVDHNGKLTRLLGDEKWKCSILRQNDWMKPDFKDDAWINASMTAVYNKDYLILPSGKKIGTGLNPAYMGLLDTAPAGRKFPVFTDSEYPSFIVKFPAGLASTTTLSYCVKNQDSDVTGKPIDINQKYSTKVGLAEFIVTLDKFPAGPYLIYWKLTDVNGELVESRSDEFVVTGPIAQDMIQPVDYERELERRLVLVRSIDCSATITDDAEFLDHAGMYNPPKLHKGKVVKKETDILSQ